MSVTTAFTSNSQYETEQFGSYVLLDDAKVFLNIVDDTTKDWALQHAIDAACASVSRFCNRPIGRTLYEPPYGVFNGGFGNTSSYIWLPKFPVLEIVSVIEYQGSTPVALAEVDPSSGDDGYRVNYRLGYIERILGGVWQRPFMPGELSVLVTWWAGMNPVPADLYLDTLMYAGDLFKLTQQRQANAPVRSNDSGNESGPWPGLPGWLKGKLQTLVMPSIG